MFDSLHWQPAKEHQLPDWLARDLDVSHSTMLIDGTLPRVRRIEFRRSGALTRWGSRR
jgi:hypothetical protein